MTNTIPATVSALNTVRQDDQPAGSFVSINTLLCEAFKRIPLVQRGTCESFLDDCEDDFSRSNAEFTEIATDWAANSFDTSSHYLYSWLDNDKVNTAFWMEFVVNECPGIFDRNYDFQDHIQKAQIAYFENCIFENKETLIYILVLRHLLKKGVTFVSVYDPLDLLENLDYKCCRDPADLFKQVDDLLVDESKEE